MAVFVIFNVPGMTEDQYDQIIRDLERQDAGAPEGRLYHAAGPTGSGWLVVDVWASREQFDAFAKVLLPIAAAANTTPPPPQVYPVHSIIERSPAAVLP